MGTNSSKNLLILATLSASALSLNLAIDNSLPNQSGNFSYQSDIADWYKNSIQTTNGYKMVDENNEKINTIISFSKKLIENSKDIDSEIVDIVNEHFWDLV